MAVLLEVTQAVDQALLAKKQHPEADQIRQLADTLDVDLIPLCKMTGDGNKVWFVFGTMDRGHEIAQEFSYLSGVKSATLKPRRTSRRPYSPAP